MIILHAKNRTPSSPLHALAPIQVGKAWQDLLISFFLRRNEQETDTKKRLLKPTCRTGLPGKENFFQRHSEFLSETLAGACRRWIPFPRTAPLVSPCRRGRRLDGYESGSKPGLWRVRNCEEVWKVISANLSSFLATWFGCGRSR